MFKPMLAYTIKDLNTVRFPCYVSRKIDGIRCLLQGSQNPLSRTLKTIPNRYISYMLSNVSRDSIPRTLVLDGELTVGNTFHETSSAVMSHEGNPSFSFHIFDAFYVNEPNMPFNERYAFVLEMIHTLGITKDFYTSKGITHHFHEIKLAESVLVNTKEELIAFYEKALEEGYEGTIVRSVNGRYKYGRSTIKEGILGKYKPFVDSEFEVMGYTQEFKNNNEIFLDELGHSKRSTSKDGLEPLESVGSLTVSDGNVAFEVGSGLTKEMREELWLTRNSLIGKIVKVKYMSYGILEKPRHPVFLGFRDKNDL